MLNSPIYDLTPMTMLDYPDELACIVWFSGCNMRCPYCYNPHIVESSGDYSLETFYNFLDKRKGLLDGVVLSGGECTSSPKIFDIATEVKKKGYKIKVDTNGSNPEVIKELVEKDLVDYIALDYKSPDYKIEDLTGRGISIFKRFILTLDFLISQPKISFEVRTTVHHHLLNEDDVNYIILDLYNRGYNNTYYIQKSLDDVEMISKLPKQKGWLDLEKLSKKIPIEIRTIS
jgi:pyruvate formate lyase activating enzyme